MKTKISVIVPVYNAQLYLEKCINSVLLQSLEEIELICIDDGSIDSSVEIIKSYMAIDNRIKLILQNHSGSGEARNKGIDYSKSSYISFMDADDYYPDLDVLKKMYYIARKNRAKICGGGIAVDKDGLIIEGKNRKPKCSYEIESWCKYKDSQDDYGYQRFIFDSKLIKKNKIDFPNYLRYQDPPFLVKAMLAAQKYYCLDFDVYCYRMGHQKINWDYRRTADLARGLYDVLVMAYNNSLFDLFKRTIDRINGEYFCIFKNGLLNGNEDLFHVLIEIERIRFDFQKYVNTDFIRVLKLKSL